MDVLHLVRAARRLGLKARSVESSTARLSRLPLPAVAEMRDAGFMVLARVRRSGCWCRKGLAHRGCWASRSSRRAGPDAWCS